MAKPRGYPLQSIWTKMKAGKMRPENEAELAGMIAAATGPLVIHGGGTRAIGRVEGVVLETGGLSGVRLYEPAALTLVVGTPAAYVLARYEFKGKEDLAFTFLSFRFAPELAVIIPLFVIFQRLNLYDSYLGLILIYQAITLPLLPSTLPKRTAMKRVPGCSVARLLTTISAARLVAPITLVGFTALSVLMSTKRSAATSAAASAAW